MNSLIRRKRASVALAVLMMVTMAARCSDSDIRKVSDLLLDVSSSVKAITDVVITAETGKAITADEARPVMVLMEKLNTANTQASVITRKINRLSPEDRASLGQILDPLLAAVDDVNGPVAAIKHAPTRATVSASIGVIRSALTIIRQELN